MSSTITGLGSGFDINSWVSQLVSAKQSATVTPLQEKLNTLQTKNTSLTSLKSKYSSLQSALQTFTKTMYSSSSDMWNKTSATTSNEAFATVSTSGSVAAAQVELEIKQIATATSATSTFSLGAVDSENITGTKFTNLANGQAQEGTFTFFVDGKEYDITIGENDSLDTVMTNIEKASGGRVKASLGDDGTFSIKVYKEEISPEGESIFEQEDTGAVLSLGSGGDTSNFADALKLHNKNKTTHSYSSSYPVSIVNTDAKMTSSKESGLAGLNISAGANIEINGAKIELDQNMSLNSLITKINNNSDVNVKASYDSLTNKVTLTSTETGESNISLSSEGTNLLNILGLTDGEGENEVLADGSQKLGQNAIVKINGNEVISTSNTITGESSGIANLSINIKKQTSEFSGNKDDDKTITLDIEPDYSSIKSALKTFVSAYNDVITTTESMTKSTGGIGRDASLSSIVSQLKQITSTVASVDGEFNMLAQIGITSDKNNVSKLTIDDEKLDKALSENIDSVKNLLSDGYMAEDDNGIFDSVLKNINSVLDVSRGYFATQSQSVTSSITSMNSRIERANTRLAAYEARITKQFNQMDTTISSLNTQLSTFSAYLGG